MSLRLVLSGIDVTLTRATSGNYPRERPTPTISRTAAGAVNRRGTSYEEPHIWNAAYIVTGEQKDDLQDMHNAYVQSPGPVTIHDLIALYSEASPRTRALASGAPAAVTVGGRVRYYAQFKGEFQGPLTVVELGNNWYKIGFQIVETEVVAA
jgi:hypothetical protein